MISFSIIIPHYNIPELLERLLKSVPLDRDDLEIIVVDDRSDTNTKNLNRIRKKYSAKNVSFFRNNHGKKSAGTCRNIGLNHASGKWVLFADADDYFTENLNDVLDILKDNTNDIVFFKSRSVYEETGKEALRHIDWNLAIEQFIEEPSEYNEIKLRYTVRGPVCKFIKRSLIIEKRLRFEETIVANDILFTAKIGFYADKVDAIEDILYVITDRETSLVKQYDRESLKERNIENYKRDRFLKSNLTTDEWQAMGYDGTSRMMGMVYNGVPLIMIIETALMYLKNGIVPIDMKKVNIWTIPGTYIKAIIKKGIIHA